MPWDYTAIQTLISDETTRTVTLSPGSVGLLASALTEMNRRYKWRGDNGALSDSQWDTVDSQIATAYLELMTEYTPPTGGGMLVAIIRDQQNSGVSGQSSDNETWRPRQYTVVRDPDNLISGQSGNQFQFISGKYLVMITARNTNALRNQLRLTNPTEIYPGQSTNENALSTLTEIIEADGTKWWTVSHWTDRSISGGLGYPTSSSNPTAPEIYMDIVLMRYGDYGS